MLQREIQIQIQIDITHETARVPIGCIVHVRMSKKYTFIVFSKDFLFFVSPTVFVFLLEMRLCIS